MGGWEGFPKSVCVCVGWEGWGGVGWGGGLNKKGWVEKKVQLFFACLVSCLKFEVC